MTTPSKSHNSSPSDSSTDSAVYIQPDIRRSRITVQLDSTIGTPISVSIPELDVSSEIDEKNNTVALDEFTPWSLETPQRYTLSADSIPTTLFGMREFTIKENRFFFNNRPLYIKGLDCTSLQHNAKLAETHLNALKAFLGELKTMGFNLIRITLSGMSGDLLNCADELGLLVEVALTKKSELDLLPELRNHPSLVIWNTLALDDLDREHAVNQDPSRLFFFSGDADNLPSYIRPFRTEAETLEVHTLAQTSPNDRLSRSYCEHLGSPSRFSYIHTLQAGAMDSDADFAASTDADLKARDLNRIVDSAQGLSEELRILRNATLISQLDGLRVNGNIAGYCICPFAPAQRPTLSEAIAELASLHSIKVAQDAVRPLVHIQQHNLVPRQETPVRVHLLNESKLEGRADLSLQVVGPTNQVLWKKKRGVRLPKSGKLLWEGSIAASGSPGLHRFVVRVMQNMKRVAESSIDFYVYPEAQQWDGTINLLDPHKRWTSLCTERVVNLEYTAPIHVIPPIANTIRAYPDNELAHIMGQVKSGAVAIVFQPPKDWNDYANIIDTNLAATPAACNSAFTVQAHYAKTHPVFDGLPARCIMNATYGDVLPASTFVESSDEDISGTFCASPAKGDQLQWGNDILVVPHGDGRLVFTNMPIFDQLGINPVADLLFTNLLKHFSRRSFPSKDGSIQVNHTSVEWLRQERQEATQSWALIGMFPHDPEAPKAEVYPPEDEIDRNATYPGWYRALTWQPHHPTARDKYLVDMDEALGLNTQQGSSSDYGIAYAYAEIIGDSRGEMRMVPESSHPVEIYLNGTLVFGPESEESHPKIYLKLGKNTLLLKFRKQPGPFNFRLNLEEMSTPIRYRWWKAATQSS